MKKTLLPSLLCLIFLFCSCEKEMATPTQDGSIYFWTDSRPTNGIQIYIDGEIQGTLTDYFSIEEGPECGERGTITVQLADGVYDYIAYQRDFYKWEGQLTISNGSCQSFLLN